MRHIIYILVILSSAVQIKAQCFPDRHNTSWFDSWISCEASQNPNSSRGISHWILYDLGHTYKLKKMHVWNLNDPDNLNDGLKNIAIDYSSDGNTWQEYGNAVLPKASGKSIYEGSEILDFGGINTRYLLITAKNNYGGKCFGLSELRIGVAPITGTELVNFSLDCDEINGTTEISWSLTNESKTIGFEVEKSYDGDQWTVVNRTGNIAVKEGVSRYSYSDKSEKDAFYRVKVIDENGKSAVSDPSFCSKGNLRLNAYPNPFVSNLKVEVFSAQEGNINYKLTDILGRIVKKGSIDPDSAVNILDFNDLNINPGNYILEVNQGLRSGQAKLIKMDTYLK